MKCLDFKGAFSKIQHTKVHGYKYRAVLRCCRIIQQQLQLINHWLLILDALLLLFNNFVINVYTSLVIRDACTFTQAFYEKETEIKVMSATATWANIIIKQTYLTGNYGSYYL